MRAFCARCDIWVSADRSAEFIGENRAANAGSLSLLTAPLLSNRECRFCAQFLCCPKNGLAQNIFCLLVLHMFTALRRLCHVVAFSRLIAVIE